MSEPSSHEIRALLDEQRTFPPSEAFTSTANVRDRAVYAQAAADPEAYWKAQAEQLEWIEPFHTVLEWKPPHAKWFVGGKINASVNCLDRHVRNGRRNKAAIIWEGEPGDRRTLTYYDLHREVNVAANVLKSLGVKRGDRVAMYMPLVPGTRDRDAGVRPHRRDSLAWSSAASAPRRSRDRINDSQCALLITADGGYRRGSMVPLKQIADEALKHTPSIRNVADRQARRVRPFPGARHEGRDHWYHRIVQDVAKWCEPEAMDSEDMLYILYTSGTTGKPKGIVHTTGGYLTGTLATTRAVFDLKDDDVYWCTADIGWVTGHSYVVYGPLANGATVLMYEGAPDWPERDRFWSLIERHGVTIFYTAPTAIRAFMKWGTELPQKHDLCSLRLLGSVGEPINPEAWMWYHEHIGGERCPIVDTWWQTETGQILITPLPGLTTTKPGSATHPFPGISVEIRNQNGDKVTEGGGLLAISRPWPAMLRGIYGNEDRYVNAVLAQVAGWRVLRRRRRPRGRRRLLSGSSVAWTTCSTSPGIASGRWRSRARSSITRPWPRPRSSAGPTTSRGRRSPRSSRSRTASTARSRWSRPCASTWSRRSAPWPGPTRSSSPPTCPRPDRARSCVACCATSPRARRSATRRRWPTPPWSRS